MKTFGRNRMIRIRATSLILCMALLIGSMGPLPVRAALDPDDEDVVDAIDKGDSASEESTSSASQSSTSSSGNSQVDQYRQEINEINKKMEDLEKQNEQLQNSIAEAKSVKEQEVAKKNALDDEIYITRSQIELLLERIELLEQEIDIKQQEIEDKQAEHDDKYRLFLKRVKAMYMYDDTTTTLGLIFGADNFVDFLTRTELVARIAEHDRELMENLTDERIQLEEIQSQLEEDKQDVEQDKQDYEEKRNELSVQVNTISLKIQDLNSMEAAFKADLEANKALAAQMENEIKSLMDKIKWSTNPYVGGSMDWPLPGYYNITSSYGWRFGGSDYHTGVDISGSGVYGKDIVAANDGTVVLANWSYTPGRGYGIYVVLDHGGNIGTLYGHCSNLAVTQGQEVKRGQKIAEVGSTGWSTGPHLHFEVRVNGSHTDPMGYLQG